MLQQEVRREILHAIIECELTGPNGDLYPAVREVWVAKALANELLSVLLAKRIIVVDDY
jgi:hypothetical protein